MNMMDNNDMPGDGGMNEEESHEDMPEGGEGVDLGSTGNGGEENEGMEEETMPGMGNDGVSE